MIAKGASALLIEPQSHYSRLLTAKYANNKAVRVLNEAVCGRMVRNATLYSVNLNNEPSFGSLYADGRCANKSVSPDTRSDWITEIASLSKQQVLNQANPPHSAPIVRELVCSTNFKYGGMCCSLKLGSPQSLTAIYP